MLRSLLLSVLVHAVFLGLGWLLHVQKASSAELVDEHNRHVSSQTAVAPQKQLEHIRLHTRQLEQLSKRELKRQYEYELATISRAQLEIDSLLHRTTIVVDSVQFRLQQTRRLIDSAQNAFKRFKKQLKQRAYSSARARRQSYEEHLRAAAASNRQLLDSLAAMQHSLQQAQHYGQWLEDSAATSQMGRLTSQLNQFKSTIAEQQAQLSAAISQTASQRNLYAAVAQRKQGPELRQRWQLFIAGFTHKRQNKALDSLQRLSRKLQNTSFDRPRLPEKNLRKWQKPSVDSTDSFTHEQIDSTARSRQRLDHYLDSLFARAMLAQRAGKQAAPLQKMQSELSMQKSGVFIKADKATAHRPAAGESGSEYSLSKLAGKAGMYRKLIEKNAHQSALASRLRTAAATGDRQYRTNLVRIPLQDNENIRSILDVSTAMKSNLGLQAALSGKQLEPPSLSGFNGVSASKMYSTARAVPRAQWFFLDRWYVVGPFPNTKRAHIETVFPPEIELNLDTAYYEFGSPPLRWRYVHASTHSVVPPDLQEYAVYYAFSHVYSDQKRDVWMAVGSDDRADMWINGIPVWQSANYLKAWNLDEAMVKVHLKQGDNAILVRLENGWRYACFSVLFKL